MNEKAPTLRLEARRTLFLTLVLAGFLAGLWLKFLADGALRGSLDDVLLVFVLASATFSVRNQQRLEPAADEADPGRARRRQSALNRSSVASWAAIAGAILSYAVNRLLYLDRADPRG